jgi:hypothetical protein
MAAFLADESLSLGSCDDLAFNIVHIEGAWPGDAVWLHRAKRL